MHFTIDEFLSHHGIKGQKWGVRRQQRREAKAEKRFERQALSVGTWVQLNNAGAEHFNAHIDALNNRPEFKAAADRKDFLNENLPITKKYNKAVSDLFLEGVRKKAAEDPLSISPSGLKKVTIRSDEPNSFFVVLQDVKHADSVIKVNLIRDENGRVTGVSIDTMEQGSLVVGDILSHHGVKGQKWGVRKTRAERVTVARGGFGGKKLKTKGGGGHSPAREAVAAAKLGQIKKASGAHALTNEQLQTYAKRLSLEQKVHNLEHGRKTRGQKFVADIQGKGQQQIVDAAANTTTKQVKGVVKARMARRAAKTVVKGLAVS